MQLQSEALCSIVDEIRSKRLDAARDAYLTAMKSFAGHRRAFRTRSGVPGFRHSEALRRYSEARATL